MKNVIFFAKKMYMACYILQASITKSLTILPMVMRKKVKRGPKKKCRFTEKRLFYTCDDNVELVPANVIFLDSRPKAFLGAHPKALCVKRIESKMHPPTNPFHPSNDLSR